MWDVKYRPMRFTDVLGQESAAQILKLRCAKGTALDTSYIFSGGHGQGKTTLARILARAMLCLDLQSDGEPCNACVNCTEILNDTSPAFTEKDAASNGTVDQLRKIVSDLPFMIKGADKRIYLFDEAHRLSPTAQDVLLKPLEEKKMVGIFCTTEAEKIRGPIRSRCEEYKIRPITRTDILGRMQWILTQEQIESEEEAVLTVIDHCHGHVRDVINKLEMIAQLGAITLNSVRDYLNLSVVSTYYGILLALGNPTLSVQLTEAACDQVGPEAVYEGLAEAAMTTYRMSHGMYVDYTQVDKALALKVQEMYGDKLLQLTEHFIGAQRPTQLRLVYDVVSCAAGVPAKASLQKVQLQVGPAIPASVVDAPVAPTAPVTAATTPTLPSPSPTPSKVPSTPPPSEKGNLGSTDPCALTSNDTKAIRKDFPRGVRDEKAKFSDKPKIKTDFLTAEEWRQHFEQRFTIFGARSQET